MDDWIDLVGRAEFLRELFPAAPPLSGIRILEVRLHQDGPCVLLRFNLNEFPVEPPAKWVQAHANRVQVRLMGIGVLQLEVRGWSSNNVADVEISAADPDGRRVVARAPGFELEGIFDHLVLDDVSAYSQGAG